VMSDDLVERVARAMASSRWSDAELWGLLKDEALIAIAIAQEEAAKVAEGNKCNSCWMAERIAAAIRALIKETNV
jgi:hypothetical protein